MMFIYSLSHKALQFWHTLPHHFNLATRTSKETITNNAAQQILTHSPHTISQPILLPLQVKKITLSQSEYVKKTLSQILTNYLSFFINKVYHIISDMLANKDGNQLPPQVIASTLSEFSPDICKKNAVLFSSVMSDVVNKHASNLLKVVKDISDDFLSNKELKVFFISYSVNLLTPLIVKSAETSANSEIPILKPTQRAVMTAVIEGIDHFFEDLIYAMNTRSSCFHMTDYHRLRGESEDAKNLENAVINTMNERLHERNIKQLMPSSRSKEQLDQNIAGIITDLLTALFPRTNLTDAEKEALINFAVLHMTKVADKIFSPQMLLHLFNTALNPPIPHNSDNTLCLNRKDDLPSSSKILDRDLANALDSCFNHFALHSIHLGTKNKLTNYVFKKLIPFLLGSDKKTAVVQKTAIAIQKFMHSPDWILVLKLAHSVLCQDQNNLNSSFKTLFTKTDDEIQEQRRNIEQAIQNNILSKKINAIVENHLEKDQKKSRTLIFLWKSFLTQYIHKSVSQNIGNATFIVLQQERLIKMLYCYLMAHIHKLITDNVTFKTFEEISS